MAGKSNYLKNIHATHGFRTGSWTKPTALFVGYATAAPTAASTGSTVTEVTGSGYARAEISVSDAAWTYSAHTTSNAVALNFTATATGTWSDTITHWFIADDDSGGNIYYFGALDVERDVSSGDNLTIGIGQIQIHDDP